MKYLTHKVAAAVSTLAIVASASDAFAQDATIGTIGENLAASASGFPKMISTAAYICGIGLGATGIFKLKQHVDKPDNVPMKDGLVRLSAGGALLALPYMTTAMTGTVSAGGSGTTEFQGDAFSIE